MPCDLPMPRMLCVSYLDGDADRRKREAIRCDDHPKVAMTSPAKAILKNPQASALERMPLP